MLERIFSKPNRPFIIFLSVLALFWAQTAFADNFSSKPRKTPETEKRTEKREDLKKKLEPKMAQGFQLTTPVDTFIFPVELKLQILSPNPQSADSARQKIVAGLPGVVKQLKEALALSKLSVSNEIMFVEDMKSVQGIPGVQPELLENLKTLHQKDKDHRVDIGEKLDTVKIADYALNLQSELVKQMLAGKKYLLILNLRVQHVTADAVAAHRKEKSAQRAALRGPGTALVNMLTAPILYPAFDKVFATEPKPQTHTEIFITLLDAQTGAYVSYYGIIGEFIDLTDSKQFETLLKEAFKGFR